MIIANFKLKYFSIITGKVTSLVAKRDLLLATRIEEALKKNESLESLSVDSIKRDIARSNITEQKEKKEKLVKASNSKNKKQSSSTKLPSTSGKGIAVKKSSKAISRKAPTPSKPKNVIKVSKTSSGKPKNVIKVSNTSSGKKQSTPSRPKTVIKLSKSPSGKTQSESQKPGSKLNVVGFRGRSSLSSSKVA